VQGVNEDGGNGLMGFVGHWDCLHDETVPGTRAHPAPGRCLVSVYVGSVGTNESVMALFVLFWKG
jgi:hypothetical protein